MRALIILRRPRSEAWKGLCHIPSSWDKLSFGSDIKRASLHVKILKGIRALHETKENMKPF